MSGQVDDYELIKLIETYPILYDKTSARGTKNATRKDEAWKEISSKMNASERACITRWKSIRDRFGKEFRRLQDNPDETMYWEMFQHLLFLKDHYKHGQVKSETLESIKFEPKDRRRKTRQRWGDGAGVGKKEEEDAEVDPNNIELNQHLIALVKEYPVLYDRHKIRDSKNIAAKNEAWRAISESLGEPEESLYKRWKKLRDRFAREYRNHQINSEAPISWIYFGDLLFLESHYRKGVPLIVENLKRRGRPRKHYTSAPANSSETSVVLDDNAWGGEYPYTSEDDDEADDGQSESVTGQEHLHYEETEDETIEIVPEPENENKYIEVKTHSLDNVILVPPDQIPLSSAQIANYTVSSSADIKALDANAACQQLVYEEPAEKLSHVISNIECVLRQSQDCLKSLHDQQQRHQLELQATALSSADTSQAAGYHPQASVIAKAQMLLDGLTLEQRLRAERKIIKFLCECQIKELNDEEIDDLMSVHIF